jgi:hypothetical protein
MWAGARTIGLLLASTRQYETRSLLGSRPRCCAAFRRWINQGLEEPLRISLVHHRPLNIHGKPQTRRHRLRKSNPWCIDRRKLLLKLLEPIRLLRNRSPYLDDLPAQLFGPGRGWVLARCPRCHGEDYQAHRDNCETTLHMAIPPAQAATFILLLSSELLAAPPWFYHPDRAPPSNFVIFCLRKAHLRERASPQGSVHKRFGLRLRGATFFRAPKRFGLVWSIRAPLDERRNTGEAG